MSDCNGITRDDLGNETLEFGLEGMKNLQRTSRLFDNVMLCLVRDGWCSEHTPRVRASKYAAIYALTENK